MIKLAKEAINKASDEMLKEAGKKAGKYAGRVVAIGGFAIAGNYIGHKAKEKGIELTKNIEKGIKDGAQNIADVVQGNKKPELIKVVKNGAEGAAKAVGVAFIAGAGAVLAAKATGYVRDAGKDLGEDMAADYRKIKYFVEEETVEILEDEIEY